MPAPDVDPLLEACLDAIEATGVAEGGVDLFAGVRPNEPDEVLVVARYDVQAMTGQTFGEQIDTVHRPRVQILSRSDREDYPAAFGRAVTARAALAALRGPTGHGVSIIQIMPLGDPAPIGFDEAKARPLVACNFDVWTTDG